MAGDYTTENKRIRDYQKQKEKLRELGLVVEGEFDKKSGAEKTIINKV